MFFCPISFPSSFFYFSFHSFPFLFFFFFPCFPFLNSSVPSSSRSSSYFSIFNVYVPISDHKHTTIHNIPITFFFLGETAVSLSLSLIFLISLLFFAFLRFVSLYIIILLRTGYIYVPPS